ncbi:GHKL domain-containing protein [bacterium]|nr:GHKL domain-containing protein [bacterium]
MSSSSITSMIQDHKGLMWIGTYYGLNLYDGMDFKIFQNIVGDQTSLLHNLVYCLYEDRHNNLWIGTARGISLYDWGKDHFINPMYDHASPLYGINFNLCSIAEDTLGNLWLGTDIGLLCFHYQQNTLTRYTHHPNDPQSLRDNNVKYVYIDSRNNMWVSTETGLYLFNDDTTFQSVNLQYEGSGLLSNVLIYYIVEDMDGRIWLASNRGLFRIGLNASDMFIIDHYMHDPGDEHSLTVDNILTLFVDGGNHLWIGTENGGLSLYDSVHDNFWHYRHDDYVPNSLNNESIHAIYQDNRDNLWIGTFSGGINRSLKNSEAILHYQHIPGASRSLSHNVVTDFMEDHRGQLWIGTDGGGLNRFDQENNRFYHYSSKTTNLTSDAVLDIIEDSHHQIWVGTWAGGLCRLNQKTGRFQSFTTLNSGIQEDHIKCILKSIHGDLWLGSFGTGLIHFNRRTQAFTSYNTNNSGLVHNLIHDIKEGSDGSLYIGTASGFCIFKPEKGRFVSLSHNPGDPKTISDNSAHTLVFENDTTLWIGTEIGLNRFDTQARVFKRYYMEDGLPDNRIVGLTFDKTGILWVTTNRGVARFNTRTEESQIFTKADGFQSNEFNRKSAFTAGNGIVYLGTTKGFNCVYPEKLSKNTTPPQILITNFYIFNKPMLVGMENSPLQSHISETREVHLSYQQSSFSFDFAVVDFTMPEKNQYAYKLEGFDASWRYVGNRRSAAYTNINPGKYTFYVKGTNNDGVWNETGASVCIIIQPPFWQCWWFRILMIIFLAAVIFGIFEYRFFQIKKQGKTLEHQVTERTKDLQVANQELEQQKMSIQKYAEALKQSNEDLESFSYSVSHDLRTPLRSMDGFSQVLIDDYQKKLDERGIDYLQRISNASQRMSHLIDGLLKLSRLARNEMHVRSVNISDMARSIAEEYRQIMPDRSMKLEIQEGMMTESDPSLIRVLLTNLIDNAWKFTSKVSDAKIIFGCDEKNGQTVYYFRDNGIGFDMSYASHLFDVFQRHHEDYEGTGIGLATVKRIVQRHGGRVWAEGKVGKGASFYFTLNTKKTH